MKEKQAFTAIHFRTFHVKIAVLAFATLAFGIAGVVETQAASETILDLNLTAQFVKQEQADQTESVSIKINNYDNSEEIPTFPVGEYLEWSEMSAAMGLRIDDEYTESRVFSQAKLVNEGAIACPVAIKVPAGHDYQLSWDLTTNTDLQIDSVRLQDGPDHASSELPVNMLETPTGGSLSTFQNASDTTKEYYYTVEMELAGDHSPKLLDVNGDGKVLTNDLILIFRKKYLVDNNVGDLLPSGMSLPSHVTQDDVESHINNMQTDGLLDVNKDGEFLTNDLILIFRKKYLVDNNVGDLLPSGMSLPSGVDEQQVLQHIEDITP